MFIPPRTNPLVAMADVERPVMVVTAVAMATIKQERAVVEKKKKKKDEHFFVFMGKKTTTKKVQHCQQFSITSSKC